MVPWVIDFSDEGVALRFWDGSAQVGPDIICAYSDAADEGGWLQLAYAFTGIDASKTYTVQAYGLQNAMPVDTSLTGMFQIIEFTSAEAALQTTGAISGGSPDDTAPAAYANISGHTLTFTPAATSVCLMIDNCPTKGVDGDSQAYFQFAIDGTVLGYGRTIQGYDKWLAAEIEGADGSHMLAYVPDGTSTEFSRQWIDITDVAALAADEARTGYFQVIEIKNSTLEHDASITGGNAVPTDWADIAGAVASAFTPAATSVNILIATSGTDIESGSDDSSVMHRFAEDGSPTEIGGIGQLAYRDFDAPPGPFNGSMAMATANVGVSTVYSFQHKLPPTAIDIDDIAINGRFQIIECKAAAAGGINVLHRRRMEGVGDVSL